MNASRVTVRPAVIADASPIAVLVTQLGYATSPAEMQERLAAILRDGQYATYVAETGHAVIGLAGIRLGRYYERNGVYAQLVVLAVEERHRGSGVGRALVEAAEAWATRHDASAVLVNSGTHRADAHRFYERLGYSVTGVRLVKQVDRASA